MPRGQKSKIFVGRASGKDGKGNIVQQISIKNHRVNLAKFKDKTYKKYCKIARKRVEIKLKEEKHSS